MKAAAALALSISMLSVGCFPNNAQHRAYAKYAEGGALVAGIAISYLANTGADCDTMKMVSEDCRTNAKWLSGVGVTLILAGLLGFVATISTAEDDESTPKVLSVEKTQGSGSAAPTATPATVTPPATEAPATVTPPATGSGDAAAPTEAPAAGSAAPVTP